jgi:hypothetical protein
MRCSWSLLPCQYTPKVKGSGERKAKCDRVSESRRSLPPMGIWETFSKRQKRRERAGKQDVYQYDDLPNPFRMQVCHIWRTALGRYYAPQGYSHSDPSPANQLWEFVHDTLARELGLGVLAGDRGDSAKERCMKFILNADTPGTLDIIELSFRAIDRGVRKMISYDTRHARYEVSQRKRKRVEQSSREVPVRILACRSSYPQPRSLASHPGSSRPSASLHFVPLYHWPRSEMSAPKARCGFPSIHVPGSRASPRSLWTS